VRLFCVYILASRARRLYTGVSSNLVRRVFQHRQKQVSSFTSKYNIARLVYYECGTNARSAIAREKQIKGWSRARKLALIEENNPRYADLAEGWFETRSPGKKNRDSSPLRGSE
jgi:putative endonuclease